MADNMKLVEDKIKALGELYTRMDETKDLVQLKAYTLKDFDGKTAIQQSISVTRNTPAWQAYVMVNKLVKVKWQTVVNSSAKLSSTRIRDIETFSDDVWAQVDEFLGDKFGMAGGLMSWLANHVIVRSLIGARWCLYYDKDDNLVIDCLPVDMRWCPFELNEWYCNITYRSAESIKAEYGEAVEVSGAEVEVRDFWDKDVEEVYVNKTTKIAEKKNLFGVPPFVIIMPSAGFMLRDKGFIKYEAEDALFLDRGLYDEMNRALSIAQTLALDTIMPATEQETEDDIAKPPVPFPMPGETVRVQKGERHLRIERGDLNNAFMKATSELEKDIDHGGVTDTEAGTNTSDRTALWVTTQNELLNEKLKPRVDALAGFRKKSMRMIIDQYIKLAGVKTGKTEREIGIHGMKHKFSSAQLGDVATYRIDYIPMMVSKEQNIANTALANAQQGLVPHRFILQETLQVEDPDGLLRELELERAKQADPSISLFEMALRYAEEAETLSGVDADAKNEMSRMLTESGVLIRRQRRLAATAQEKPLPEKAQVPQLSFPEGPKSNTQGLRLLTGPGGNGGAPGGRSVAKVTAEAR